MAFKKRALIAGAALLAATSGGLAAYAAWSATGSGSGAAKALSAQPITITASSSPTADLYPGKTGGTLYLVLSNPNPYAVTMTGVSYGAVTSLDQTNCASSNVTVDNGAPSTVSFSLAANATGIPETIPGVLDMSHGALDPCQGVSFSVAVTLTGAQQ